MKVFFCFILIMCSYIESYSFAMVNEKSIIYTVIEKNYQTHIVFYADGRTTFFSIENAGHEIGISNIFHGFYQLIDSIIVVQDSLKLINIKFTVTQNRLYPINSFSYINKSSQIYLDSTYEIPPGVFSDNFKCQKCDIVISCENKGSSMDIVNCFNGLYTSVDAKTLKLPLESFFWKKRYNSYYLKINDNVFELYCNSNLLLQGKITIDGSNIALENKLGKTKFTLHLLKNILVTDIFFMDDICMFRKI